MLDKTSLKNFLQKEISYYKKQSRHASKIWDEAMLAFSQTFILKIDAGEFDTKEVKDGE